jgi:hypothetical protein
LHECICEMEEIEWVLNIDLLLNAPPIYYFSPRIRSKTLILAVSVKYFYTPLLTCVHRTPIFPCTRGTFVSCHIFKNSFRKTQTNYICTLHCCWDRLTRYHMCSSEDAELQISRADPAQTTTLRSTNVPRPGHTEISAKISSFWR